MRRLWADKERRFNLAVTIGLMLLSVLFVLPLYWTAVFATRTLTEVFQFPPPFWFGSSLLDNYARIEAVFPPFRPIIRKSLSPPLNTATICRFASPARTRSQYAR